jgi:hypothetical protein
MAQRTHEMRLATRGAVFWNKVLRVIYFGQLLFSFRSAQHHYNLKSHYLLVSLTHS